MTPAVGQEALSDDARLTSDVCLSVAYIRPESRTERPVRRLKLAQKQPTSQVTGTPLSTSFKVKNVKCQLAGAVAYCGGLQHSLLPHVNGSWAVHSAVHCDPLHSRTAEQSLAAHVLYSVNQSFASPSLVFMQCAKLRIAQIDSVN